MPKECDCTEKSLGLSTLYPVGFDYCPRCGKRLQDITEAELLEKFENMREETI